MINEHPFIIELQTVDSTNSYAFELLKTKKVQESTVIFAHEQTSGKGQGSNNWESAAGANATFSIILYPHFLSPGQQFLLNETIALGVLDFLHQLGINSGISIKWPNDIYVGNQKIGGILIENTICGTVFELCIAGIGFNINQMNFSSFVTNPVSLKQITGKDYLVRDVVDRIVGFINKRYSLLQQGAFGVLNEEYKKNLFGKGEWRDYFVNKKLIKGKINGVDESGLLIVEMETSAEQHFQHGEIGFILT